MTDIIQPNKISIKLTNLNLVSQWQYKLDNCDDRNCKICNSSLDNVLKLIFNDKNNTNFENKIYVGKCKHTFHKQCIESHMKENNMCPVCNNLWDLENVFSDSISKSTTIGIKKST
jgi:hypothetical protein